jgi:hypothetical protein
MHRLSSAAQRSVAAIAAALAASVVALHAGSPAAAADGDRELSIWGTAACDRAAGEWIVTWTLTNQYDVAGTLGNLRAYPPDRPIVGLPSRIAPGASIAGVQRLLAAEHTASIVVDVNWDDGPVGYNYHWPTYIYSTCAPT